MEPESLRQAILAELARQDATDPEQAVDVIAVRQTVGALQTDFERALAELTDKERVGLVVGKLYVRRNL
ncbi:hypothetical protein [Solirhodobacter olei]|uniref:hypothetical protein n=1 Tax=Solirhodobacter olei TaxID=2493082 RepID=UPI000FD6D435|nr:hypothetical protein [Solirhodobacter olei]